MPAHVDERRHAAEAPEAYVARLARRKADHLAARFPGAWVLGADTVVVLGQRVLGKPADAAAARAMLRSLSGREHTVMTGVAVVRLDRGAVRADVVRTRVRFRALQAADIEAYIATGEPFDKAGAYAIQGRGGRFVTALEGCYNNVVGLPVARAMALLRAAGYGAAGVVRELHAEGAASLAGGAQIGRVAEGLGERHERFQHVPGALVVDALDDPAAALQAADDAAHEGLGDEDLEAHHRLQEDGPRRFQGAVEGLAGGNAERQRGAVVAARQAAQLDPHVDHRVALQDAGRRGVQNPLPHRIQHVSRHPGDARRRGGNVEAGA